jgi:hypothetical protein
MRHIIYLLCLLSFSFNLTAQSKLSEQAKITLLTCSPGHELHTLYGHTAIRINDPVAGFDLVFNYGTFDFETSYFYLKFANGNLKYKLAYGQFSRFLLSYQYEKRGVWEQTINFSQAEKQKFFDAILLNAKPENKFYRYDFFFDNCATRVRDIIIDNTDGEVVYDTKDVESFTYRDIIHQYEANYPWISDGLDVILGMKTDDDANQFNQMFMPDYLMQHLSSAKISGEEPRPLLGEPKVILPFNAEATSSGIKPSLVFWLLFALSLLLAYYEIKRNKPVVLLNRFILLVTGIVGGLIFFLWFLSRHSVTGDNFNILWAFPFNLFVAFLAGWFFKSKPFKFFLLFLMVSALIPLVFAWAIPQYLPAMVYPICLLIVSRYASWYYLLTRP